LPPVSLEGVRKGTEELDKVQAASTARKRKAADIAATRQFLDPKFQLAEEQTVVATDHSYNKRLRPSPWLKDNRTRATAIVPPSTRSEPPAQEQEAPPPPTEG
jgi:hypothetical protein